jgi:hypothetical protein
VLQNSIVLGKHSFLGPIDPQFIFNTSLRQRSVSAEAIIEQFETAQKECGDATKLAAWLPMLSQYGPDLLVKCRHACKMSKRLVQGWLGAYMFAGDRQSKKKAAKLATWLARHRHFKSHGRHIPRHELEAKGFVVEHLEADERFQDLVLSVFHATNHTFTGTSAVKIIENHEGRAFIKSLAMQVPIQMQAPVIQPAPTQPPTPPERSAS